MAASLALNGIAAPALSLPEQTVALQIGTCSPAEMLDRVRKTQVYILSGVSRQVENELKGFKRSVQRLSSNMTDQSPVVGIQRWKRSIKACLLRCQDTLVNLERWVKREMNSWRGVFSRFEKMVSKADQNLCRTCQMEEKHRRSFYGEKSEKEKEAEASQEIVDPYAPSPPLSPPPPPPPLPAQTCHPHHWVVISVDILSEPEFDAKMSEDPREFLVNLEKYFKRSGWNEKVWLSQVDKHLKGAAKKWWEYRQETVESWHDFKVAFLQYCERLLVREAIKRDLDLPQRRWEPLEQFVWKKRALYHRLYADANEEDMIRYIISTLHPEIRRFLKPPLPKTMDQLVQMGKEIQFDFEQSEMQTLKASFSDEQISTKLNVIVTKDPYDSNSIKDPYDSNSIKDPYGSSIIKDPYESNIIKDPYESSIIKDPYESSIIKDPYESSIIKDPYESSIIKDPYESSCIKDPYEISSIKDPYDSNNICTEKVGYE